MDYNDMEVQLNHVSLIKESCWRGHYSFQRSPHLSPIYIERFRGERTNISFGYHRFWEFVCVISGDGKFLIEDQDDLALIDSRVFLIPPGISHAEYTERKMDTIWVGCKGSILGNFPSECVSYVTHREVVDKFVEVWKLAQRGYGYIGMELDGKCLDILGHFQRLLMEGEQSGEQDIVEQAVAYINEHFADDLTVADLAEKLNCSEGHFFRLFKKRLNQTPIAYLSRIRVQNAAQWLMRSTMTVGQIAGLVGYQDQFYFSRAFKKIAGVSPKVFRDRFRKGQNQGAMAESE